MDLQVKNAVVERNVRYLLHFTQAENLPSIMKNGLLPRSVMDKYGVGYKYNDDIRLDGYPESISVSVHFPNYKMFYRIRRNNPNCKWVVLLIDAQVLYNKDCVFCFDNAACSEVQNTPLVHKKGASGFERMFEECPDKPSRAMMGIPNHYPTNPQAEVLVFSSIELKYIIGVMFCDLVTLEEYRKCIPESIKAVVDPRAYAARNDFDHWR